MASPVRPTLQAIVDQAVRATGASTGWLLAVAEDSLRVVAVAGAALGSDVLDDLINPSGARGYVLSSGQPAALMPQSGDAANSGAGGFDGVPTSVLALPCGDDTAVGVLELADKAGGLPFTFDDIEALSVLASVAGAALVEHGVVPVDVATPAQLAADLERLRNQDPRRYADAARMIESLLGQGA